MIKGERVRIKGYLEDFALSKNEADDLIMSAFIYQITKWYQTTNHDRKIQVSAALVAGAYGLVFVLHLLTFSIINGIDLSWRFYGLGGLITTPLLFGYMLGNLGVSPTSGEVVS